MCAWFRLCGSAGFSIGRKDEGRRRWDRRLCLIAHCRRLRKAGIDSQLGYFLRGGSRRRTHCDRRQPSPSANQSTRKCPSCTTKSSPDEGSPSSTLRTPIGKSVRKLVSGVLRELHAGSLSCGEMRVMYRSYIQVRPNHRSNLAVRTNQPPVPIPGGKLLLSSNELDR